MKIKISKEAYNRLQELLNKENITLERMIERRMNEYISLIKSSFKWKDSEITKDIINRITNNNERFNFSRMVKIYKITFVEADEIYTYLEQAGFIEAKQKDENKYKNYLKDNEEVEVEINLSKETEEEFKKYTKVYGETLEGYFYDAIYEYQKENQIDDSLSKYECVQNLIAGLKGGSIKKEELTIARIQILSNCGFRFVGGIVGENQSSASDIVSSTNFGNITGEGQASVDRVDMGGIAGTIVD